MEETAFISANGVACLACLGLAACAPRHERYKACALATAFVIAWALYIMSWAPFPPAAVFWAVGIKVTSYEMWAMQDAVVGMLAMAIARDVWFGWVIWSIAISQEVMHASFDIGVWDYGRLSHSLDTTFWATVACFMVVGGPGVWNRINSGIGSLRRLGAGNAYAAKTVSRDGS